MELQLNLEARQAIKNLTQAGIDEEQATVLVSTFGNSSNNIATKDDLEVVKQEMKAMDNKQSQRSNYLEKTLTQQMKAMEARQSQEMKAMDARQSQEMKAMDAKQCQRSDYLEKSLTQQMGAMDDKQFQRSEYLEKNLTKEISKSRYVMFAAGAGGALIMLGLYEALGRFLN